MKNNNTVPYFLLDGGEMGELIRTKDWSKTPLCAPENWPQSLQTMVSVMLNNPFGMYIAWGNEYIQLYNDGYRPILGANKHPAALGISTRETFSEIWHTIGSMFDGVMNGKAVGFPDFKLTLNRNGFIEECYFDFAYSPIKKEDGEIGGVLVTVIETTNKKRVEEDLAESENRFRKMAEETDILIAMGDETSKGIYFNKAWGEFTGRPVKELLDFGWADLIHDEDRKNFVDIYLNAFEKREPWIGEFRMLNKEGNYRSLLAKGSPRFSPDGTFAGYISSSFDITGIKKAESDLKESEQRFRGAIRAVNGVLWTNNSEGKMSGEQKGWASLTGQKQEEYQDYGWTNAIHPEDVQDTVDAWNESLRKKKVFIYEHRVRLKEGNFREFSIRAIPLLNPDGSIREWVGVHTDITERKLSEKALKESEQRFRNVADSAPVLIWMCNMGNFRSFFNKGWLDFTGRTIEQESDNGWTAGIHPEDLERCLKVHLHSFTNQCGFYIEYRLRRYDGKYRWISENGALRIKSEGVIEGFIGACTDIQLQKEFSIELEKQVIERTEELRQKNEELKDMNKELQSFAYISSHDLQEPLRKIQMFSTHIVEKEFENLSDRGKDTFLRMQNSAKKMQTLIADLLSYSRTNTAERKFERIKLTTLVEEVQEDLAEELKQKSAVIELIDMVEVKVIPFQFRQLLYNLISNSLKFSHKAFIPHIKIKCQIAKDIPLITEKFDPTIEYCHISVSDNGIGFEQQYNEKIFELFQRLYGKNEYEGTGIGLAIVKKIVENHHGFITSKGQLNKGATFDIFIPAR